jgi:hypothetical protein
MKKEQRVPDQHLVTTEQWRKIGDSSMWAGIPLLTIPLLPASFPEKNRS